MRPPSTKLPLFRIEGITKHVGTDDVGVMWRMVDGVPTIAWDRLRQLHPDRPSSQDPLMRSSLSRWATRRRRTAPSNQP
jgi:hypothetical protein